jgi:hypothetical protein
MSIGRLLIHWYSNVGFMIRIYIRSSPTETPAANEASHMKGYLVDPFRPSETSIY